MSTLHVVALGEIIELDSNVSLSSKTSGNDEISYTLADSNFETLKTIEVSLRGNSSVVQIQLVK